MRRSSRPSFSRIQVKNHKYQRPPERHSEVTPQRWRESFLQRYALLLGVADRNGQGRVAPKLKTQQNAVSTERMVFCQDIASPYFLSNPGYSGNKKSQAGLGVMKRNIRSGWPWITHACPESAEV